MDANLLVVWWSTVWFDIFFTISKLPNLHPCWRLHATKCVQRTIALYQYKVFNLFPFYVIEFCEVVILKLCDRNQGFLFFSRHARPPLGLWLPSLQCEWINILLRTPSIWLLLDSNALRFSLHLAECVVREIQKTKRSVIFHFFFFYLPLVASLRFSLVSLCVHFVFSAAALHFLVRLTSKLIPL